MIILEIMCKMAGSQKNILSNQKNDNITNEPYLSKSVFNELQKSLIRQEIEFENISTEDKKNDDKNIVCNNIVTNNLLNILNKTHIPLNTYAFNQTYSCNLPKIITSSQINNIDFFNNHKDFEIKKNKVSSLPLYINSLLNKFKKNDNTLIKSNKCNNQNNSNNLHEIHFHHDDIEKKSNIYNINKNNTININNDKSFITLSNIKNNRNDFIYHKNINKIDHYVRNVNVSKDVYKKEYIKSSIDPLFLYDSNNASEWKKTINHKILLAISHKDHQAEIYLKPEYLGAIYVKLNVKDDEATLKFISNHSEVRKFLDNHVSFLRDSLKNNGIALKKLNICGSLNNQKIQESKRIICKNIVLLEKNKKMFHLYEKNIKMTNNQEIDLYI